MKFEEQKGFIPELKAQVGNNNNYEKQITDMAKTLEEKSNANLILRKSVVDFEMPESPVEGGG